jgi:hypothetical protein
LSYLDGRYAKTAINSKISIKFKVFALEHHDARCLHVAYGFAFLSFDPWGGGFDSAKRFPLPEGVSARFSVRALFPFPTPGFIRSLRALFLSQRLLKEERGHQLNPC